VNEKEQREKETARKKFFEVEKGLTLEMVTGFLTVRLDGKGPFW